MNRQARAPSSFSKVSVKSQTVIPREVRERLKLKPGDTLRYRVTDDGVLHRQGAGERGRRSVRDILGMVERSGREGLWEFVALSCAVTLRCEP